MWFSKRIQRISPEIESIGVVLEAKEDEPQIKITVEPTDVDTLLDAEFKRMADRIEHQDIRNKQHLESALYWENEALEWERKYKILFEAVELAKKIQFKESIKE